MKRDISSKLAPKWRTYIPQRLINAQVDHLRPQRWNWSAIVQPLDQRLAHQANDELEPTHVFSLRYFWLDGLFASISENFYLGFIPLFALAYGASNEQVGWLTAVANLLGALAFFPGARLAERGHRKPLVLWSGGGIARAALLLLSLLPLITQNATLIIVLIIGLNALRSFMSNLANPAWTAMVADLVPEVMRGRYFGSRSMAMGVAALVVTPLAGRIISTSNGWFNLDQFGYQIIFFLAFATGMVSTVSFGRIREPQPSATTHQEESHQTVWQILWQSPGFMGLVISAFIFNLALQLAAPFFNVYLVNEFQASATAIGLLASVSSLTALAGQQVFGRLLDQKGALWVQQVCGFMLPLLPLGWVFITAPWQVVIINMLGGFAWAGYNLSNFNLLLHLTPDEGRPRAVAVYQTVVFASAVIGPLLGGYLADAVSYQFIFGVSSGGRLLGVVLFVFLTVRHSRASKQ